MKCLGLERVSQAVLRTCMPWKNSKGKPPLVWLWERANIIIAKIVRKYGKKQGDAGMFFNAVICFFAAIFFVITDKNILLYQKELLPYAIINCVFFAGGFYFMYIALSEGSFIVSKMLSSASIIIPVYYGKIGRAHV